MAAIGSITSSFASSTIAAQSNIAANPSVCIADPGQDPHDKVLTDLIGELVTRSDVFRTRWAAHNVRFHRTGIKRIHHPEVGDLELVYEAMTLPTNPDWFMFGFTPAEPASPTEERLRLLASLAASPAPASLDGFRITEKGS
jgi:hypothetical protein